MIHTKICQFIRFLPALRKNPLQSPFHHQESVCWGLLAKEMLQTFAGNEQDLRDSKMVQTLRVRRDAGVRFVPSITGVILVQTLRLRRDAGGRIRTCEPIRNGT